MKSLSIFALALAALGHTVQAADRSREQNITGTYEFVICTGECSFKDRTNVIASAIVVLFNDVMNKVDQERIDPYHYDPSDVRACYVVNRNKQKQSKSYVGVSGRPGVSPWIHDGRILQFSLFHSPDAGYVVEVGLDGNLLTGTGKSWGVGSGAPPSDFGTDNVIGRRLGPPAVSKCASTSKL